MPHDFNGGLTPYKNQSTTYVDREKKNMEDDFQTNLTSFVCLRIERVHSATIYHAVPHWSLNGQQCSPKSASPRSIGDTRGRTTGISSLVQLRKHTATESVVPFWPAVYNRKGKPWRRSRSSSGKRRKKKQTKSGGAYRCPDSTGEGTNSGFRMAHRLASRDPASLPPIPSRLPMHWC